MTRIKPQPGIMEIAPYVGGQSHVAGVSNVVKLSSNENPYGPSPAAQEAVRASAARLHRYPSTDHADLRAAIADVHGLDASRIVCGVGSDEVLQFVVQCYAGPGDEVLHTEHGFSMYPILSHAAGATPIKVAERDRQVDVDALLAAAGPKTRVVFLTNPGNPTGTVLPPSEVARLADGLPEQTILVLDGAYAEYVDEDVDYDPGIGLADTRHNVVMTRTFSKIYGLGGLRVGWGYASAEVADVLGRIRQPFNLSQTALQAAEAAVRDRAFVAFCRSENARLRVWLIDALAELGVPCDRAHANFVLARFADAEEAGACDVFLQRHGLIVRRVSGYNLPDALRITVGDEPSCRRVAHVIGLFKAGTE